jgi:hypothetical protein
LVESNVVVRTCNGVPSGTVTVRRVAAGAGVEAGALGAASARGVLVLDPVVGGASRPGVGDALSGGFGTAAGAAVSSLCPAVCSLPDRLHPVQIIIDAKANAGIQKRRFMGLSSEVLKGNYNTNSILVNFPGVLKLE